MSVESSGTQTTNIGTDHTLDTITTAGTYVLVVNKFPLSLADDDELDLSVFTKVLTGSTINTSTDEGLYDRKTFGPNDKSVVVSIPIESNFEIQFIMNQTAGVTKDLEWSIQKIA